MGHDPGLDWISSQRRRSSLQCSSFSRGHRRYTPFHRSSAYAEMKLWGLAGSCCSSNCGGCQDTNSRDGLASSIQKGRNVMPQYQVGKTRKRVRESTTMESGPFSFCCVYSLCFALPSFLSILCHSHPSGGRDNNHISMKIR